MSANEFDVAIFDMDGVITQTAKLHARAWQLSFDEFLAGLEAREGRAHEPFDIESDYRRYVDGKPRFEGVRSFLAARAIELPEGRPGDGPDAATVQGLGALKDGHFKVAMRRDGVEVFGSTIALIEEARTKGIKIAVVTSSRNGREVLESAGIEELFDLRMDGLDAEAQSLRGKPHPDTFVEAAGALDALPERAVVVEDAVSGVEAGRAGGFGLVVGVDRGGNREALAGGGADLVVADLVELSLSDLESALRDKRERLLSWRVEQEGFDPVREHDIESLFSVGNGYLGVRGSVDTPVPSSQGDLFIAGVYDRKQPGRPYSESEFKTENRGDYAYHELVSLPFPFRMGLALEGEPLDLAGPHWRVHRRVLDLSQGVLYGQADYETDEGRWSSVRTRRCASLADLHLLLQEVEVRLDNHSGAVSLDFSLADPDLAAHHPHLRPLEASVEGLEVLRFSTQVSGIEICLASRATLVGGGKDALAWEVPGAIGERLLFRRFVMVYTSRDTADPTAAAVEAVSALSWDEFDTLFAAHSGRWAEVWKRADVRIVGSPATSQALRFNAYHLISTADRDPRISVGARALTGRAYEGHIFWDVEIFKLPFYLHTQPEIAKNLLLYRYHTLDGARGRARELGFPGACYAWESTVTGEDVTPRTILLKTTGKQIPIFTGTQQIHVTAGVAYGLWRYWEATGDEALLCDAGVEILAETARFWARRCSRGEDRYHIREVVGPDEYHHSVDDNAYTNWMARFNLEKAVEAVAWMRKAYPGPWNALAERIELAPDEPAEWAEVAARLFCPGPGASGVIEQFAGFFELEEYPLPREERFKAPVSRLFDWDRINRLKLIKQADVLMLLHLFPEAFSAEVLAANYRYYEPITDHGSSLSPGIHAAIAARVGLYDEAERYWRESLWLDLSNSMGNSALGVHPACMGGTWQALIFGFLGVRFEASGPVANPAQRLPKKWREVTLSLIWRGKEHPIHVTGGDAP